ncbi:ROK family protein [Paenibacillus sp. CF384]|uniref:ROK family protein n=1 Tax=Paenibacillus sp. CF384 TaxID=1884382 RepID=UPI00089455A5|nr:ROK family protein [Paenibacillus sp. CF384]SDW76754.1 glucokinase [Paenibacillus sp. CF384]
MTEGIYLGFDVGGTSVKAGVIDAAGHILEHTLHHYESKANASSSEILAHFVDMAVDLISRVSHEQRERIRGIGYAFPGPFDYEQGISYIRGLDKFESLYGMNFGDRLTDLMRSDSRLGDKLDADIRLRFANDASLFAIGESNYGKAAGVEKALCLTIGTGIGSGFIENGAIVTEGAGIPANGWMYQIPYRSGIADDYISRRGLLRLASDMGMDTNARDVKEIADLAIAGDENAVNLFEAFGRQIAEVIMAVLQTYNTDMVVLGGQISKSGALFIPSCQQELKQHGIHVPIVLSDNTLHSTMLGIYRICCR